MTAIPGGTVEFSRKLRLDRLAAGDVEADLTATQAENAALAERFGLLRIEALSGHLRVRRPAGGPLIRVEGHVTADVRQTCVVSLEPFAAHVEDDFVQLYTLEPDREEGEVFVSPEDEDTPEPLDADFLDLGEIVAEQLALALDPYPRKPSVSFEGASFGPGTKDDGEGVGGDEEGDTPFAALKHLKNG